MENDKQTQTQTQTILNKLELIPLSKWNDYFEYPTVGSLRQLVFYEHENGFGKVIRRIGKRIYIKTADFFKWVEETNRRSL